MKELVGCANAWARLWAWPSASTEDLAELNRVLLLALGAGVAGLVVGLLLALIGLYVPVVVPSFPLPHWCLIRFGDGCRAAEGHVLFGGAPHGAGEP